MNFTRTFYYAISGAAGLALLTSASVLAETGSQKPAAKQIPKVDKTAQQPQAKPAPGADKASQQPQAKKIPKVKQTPLEKQALRTEKAHPAAPKQPPEKKAEAAPTMPQKKLSAIKEPKKATLEKTKAPVKQAAKQQPLKKTAQAKAAAPTEQEATTQPNNESSQQQAQDEQGLRIDKIVLAKDIDEGQPIEPGTSFSQNDGRIFALIYIDNPEREQTTVRVSWQRDGGPHWRGFPLEIPAASKYRTVARTVTSTREPGIYKCVVSDDSGAVLDLAQFKITE